MAWALLALHLLLERDVLMEGWQAATDGRKPYQEMLCSNALHTLNVTVKSYEGGWGRPPTAMDKQRVLDCMKG